MNSKYSLASAAGMIADPSRAAMLMALLDGSSLPAVRAAAYANTIWLLQFGQTVGLGLIFLVAGHVSLVSLFEPPDRLELAADETASAG